MHEFSLINNLLNKIYAIAANNQVKSIIGLKVKLGAMSHMSTEHFREHFEEAAKGGIAENAKLEVCLDDDQKSPTAQDILLESIEVET